MALISIAVPWKEGSGTRMAPLWENTMSPWRVLSKQEGEARSALTLRSMGALIVADADGGSQREVPERNPQKPSREGQYADALGNQQDLPPDCSQEVPALVPNTESLVRLPEGHTPKAGACRLINTSVAGMLPYWAMVSVPGNGSITCAQGAQQGNDEHGAPQLSEILMKIFGIAVTILIILIGLMIALRW